MYPRPLMGTFVFLVLLIVAAILLLVADHELVIFVAIAIILSSIVLMKRPFSNFPRATFLRSAAVFLLVGAALIIGLSKAYEGGDEDGEAMNASGRWIGVGAILLTVAGSGPLPSLLSGRKGSPSYASVPAFETISPLYSSPRHHLPPAPPQTPPSLPNPYGMTREEMANKIQKVPLGKIDRVAIMTHTTVPLGTVPPRPDNPNVFEFVIVPKAGEEEFPTIPRFSQVSDNEELFIYGGLSLLQKIFKGIRGTVSVCDEENLRPPCLTKIPSMASPIYHKDSVVLEMSYGLHLADSSSPIEELVFSIYLNKDDHVYVGMKPSATMRRAMIMDWKSPQNIMDELVSWADDADITVDGIMSMYPTQSRSLGRALLGDSGR